MKDQTVELYIVIFITTLILGKNPSRGGSPPNEKRVIKRITITIGLLVRL